MASLLVSSRTVANACNRRSIIVGAEYRRSDHDRIGPGHDGQSGTFAVQTAIDLDYSLNLLFLCLY